MQGRTGSKHRIARWTATAVAAALVAPGAAQADAVVDWSATAAQLTTSARTHTIMHLAIHDTLNAVDRRFEPYAFTARDPEAASPDAAVAASAHRVLLTLLPASARPPAAAAYQQRLDALPDDPAKDAAVALGEQVADDLLARRTGDGFGPQFTYTYRGGDAPGQWRPTPPAFMAGLGTDQSRATPFVLRERDQFGLEPPVALDSAQYAMELDEVRRLGGREGSPRTGQQTDIARAWAVSGPTLVTQWLRALATERDTDLWQSARLFASALAASTDAAVATFHYKYLYEWWRPVTAIRMADEDGTPATAGDPGWVPLLDTPPFPEYPSAHCAATGAATEVMGRFFGTDRLSLTCTSPAVPGFARTVTDLGQIEQDCEDARVWGGIHFRTSDRTATSLGRRIGHFVAGHALRAMPGHVKARDK